MTVLFVMPMPLNADGNGPEMDPEKVVSTNYEVWDDDNDTVGVLRPESARVFAAHDALLAACKEMYQSLCEAAASMMGTEDEDVALALLPKLREWQTLLAERK